MSIKSIGPMVAHSTDSTIRLWYRCDGEIVCRILLNNSVISAQTKRASLEVDCINLFEFSQLIPNTLYQYEFLKESKIVARGEAKTFELDQSRKCSFITGSCRHHPTFTSKILRWLSFRFGSSDDSFKTISKLINQKNLDPDFFIMCGDQVYADHPHWSVLPLGSAKSYNDYQWHYQKAYSTPFFSKLAARYPFYMAMDDHEIKNDWKMDMAKSVENQVHLKNGLKAYSFYQAALSSVIQKADQLEKELLQINKINIEKVEEDRKLYYQFEQGPASLFVMDCRIERYSNSVIPQMIAPQQMHKLKEWLLNGEKNNKVKFIVSSVPFFPDAQNIPLLPGAPEDKWAGFPEQRLEILEFIRTNKIRKVVFISGDVHVSLTSELTHRNDPDFRIHSVICSGFFWPMKGLSLKNFNWENLAERHMKEGDKSLPNNETRGPYQVKMLSHWSNDLQAHHQKQNFCSIETDGKQLDIHFYLSSNGDLFEKHVVDL